MTHVLDHPVWAALNGAHARLGHLKGEAARYPSDVAPFAALRPGSDGRAWADLAAITEPGEAVATVGAAVTPPAGWEVLEVFAGVQLVDVSLRAAADPEAVRLGPADVDEMLDLIARTEPGPFRRRTVELGTYLGIRREGRLVAMGGERMQPPGWTEISAVCTDPAYRGQGLATRIVRAVAAGVRARGETPFMHASADNTAALRLYESIGFRLRRDVVITVVEPRAA
ncbi:GNAT family N-acetyltransferase [Phytohabitans houttuyneae]|uniref:GNAT family N-acetyltransferase n=1 Tax=Phytohabitans houttuyneae TaxID=1076126 RepID=UPI00280B51A8|nr:GNAT family N-acetyltransferase [Phytohabitans houttuyneae]